MNAGCDLLNPSKMFSLAKVVLNNLVRERDASMMISSDGSVS